MQVKVETLREALELLKPVVPGGKTQVDAVRHVLIQDGKAMATDLEQAAVVNVPGASGTCLVPHKSTLETLKRVPGSQLLTIEPDNGMVKLLWDGGKVSLNTRDEDDFPSIPRVEGDMVQYNGDRLIRAMQDVEPYCARDDSRPVLAGVILSPANGQLDVWAGDGYRLAVEYLPFVLPCGKLIIPAKAVRTLAHLWKKAAPAPDQGDDIVQTVLNERLIELTVGTDNVAFSFGRVKFITRPISGEAPNYRNLVPDVSKGTTVEFYAPDFERVVMQSLGASEQLRLRWDTNTMTVATKGEDGEEAEATLDVRADGEGEIAFSANYLLAYLKNREGMVRMTIVDKSSPGVFQAAGAPLLLQMPMFLRDDEGEQSPGSGQDDEGQPDEAEAADEVEE